ncbi:MAG: serine hydrolase [Bacteroidetes bacterium B1(2017)]|nr:MAG: serine hydrolase [Bacteroidetes bacterium B1(2017)]
MKKIVSLSLIILLFLSFKSIAQPRFITDSLETFVLREMQRWQVPGLAIAIVKDGKVVVCKGYGVKSIKDKQPVDEYSLFQIASNSKAFTGTSIALLDYQKKISLDAKVTSYLPWFKLYEPTSTELCTVRDLLTHRIGHGTFQGDFLNWGSNLTRKEIIEGMGRTIPKYPFRYKYGYCNAGYITAGELIPVVTGLSWDEYIKKTFFEPLGMQHTNTSFESMKNDANSCAPHSIYKGKLVQAGLTNIENMGPSASINSCVADMSKWLLMQLDSGRFNGQQIVPFKVLQETRKSQMISNDFNSRLFPSKHFANYGLGWNSYDYNSMRVWEHSGGANGFVTKTEFIPEANLGVIVYTNSDANSLYDAMAKQIIEAYLNMPYRNVSEIYFNRSAPGVEKEKKDLDSLLTLASSKVKLPVDIKKFEGAYSNYTYGTMLIKAEKGKLKMYLKHHPDNIGQLEYLGNNKFLCTYSDITCGIEVLPFTLENGEVKSLDVKVNDFIDYETYTFEHLLESITIEKKPN